ncbi:hypothetical protein [Pseudoclavibacter terrae]|uniref:hypothetical protein n=1 Tax=Pseudoclavibacter terrae TaxID=1530195 RepID=UPI00232BFB18|nr:hypothetical protein [Pseudoclavibacter terrae]
MNLIKPDPDNEEPASPSETRQIYLDRTKSGYTKLRHSFVQTRVDTSHSSRPGTLAKLTRNHRATVLYLALLANWPWLSREDGPISASAWIRFLTSNEENALTWNPQSLSNAWRTLKALDLVELPRQGRLIRVTPRSEAGVDPYKAPTGKGADSYLVVPHELWTKELHATLSWPALSALLILLKETGSTPTTTLKIDQAQAWYGISRTTTEKGLTELRAKNLLSSRDRWIKDANAPEGRRFASEHTLQGDFSTERREALREAAKKRVRPTPPSAMQDKAKASQPA